MENDKLVRLSTIRKLFDGCDYSKPVEIPFLLSVLEQLPAVDAVEVRHGYWKTIGHKSVRVCSHCEKDEPYKFADDDVDIFDYCPHCGARMRREDGSI